MIYHIVPRSEWAAAAAAGEYRPASLAGEGFIHFSTREQVVPTANALFAGRADLLLLAVDPGTLVDPVIYEDCYETGQEFPHLYGPLPITAVTQVYDFPCEEDGRFGFPVISDQ